MANNLFSQSDVRGNRFKILRWVFLLLGLFLIFYVKKNSMNHSSAFGASCPPCSCDCLPDPILPMSLEAINVSFADCGKNDPDINNELKKDIAALLYEEISLHQNVTNDSLERTKALIMDAKRTSSHYQKEAEKCNAGMETCEEARERAEASLIEERKLTAMWMSRAHEYGWQDDGSGDFV